MTAAECGCAYRPRVDGRHFPDQVRAALSAAGWSVGKRDEERARQWGLRLSAYSSVEGRTHTFFPAALEALAEFGGVVVPADASGEEVAVSGFALDPELALHTVSSLANLGAALSTRLFPLGVEGEGCGILAVDETGRVFLLDHAGEWFLGGCTAEALVALVTGRLPALLREDGSWPGAADPPQG